MGGRFAGIRLCFRMPKAAVSVRVADGGESVLPDAVGPACEDLGPPASAIRQGTDAPWKPAPVDSQPSPAPRLVLPDLDKRAIATLVSDDPAALLEYARGLAEALAGEDAEGTRARTISRMLATSRAELAVLDILLAEALRKRKFEGATALTKACTRLDRRILGLLDQHRAETSPRRPSVGIRAETVNVLSVEKGR